MVILLAVVLMSGCATKVTAKSVMEAKVGYPIDDVTAAWGAPDLSMKRADGGTAYTWITTYSEHSIVTDQSYVKQCRASFVTDSSEKIKTWSLSGCSKYW